MTTSGIQTLPGDRHAGLDFNYAVWTANTTVSFANVPWDGAYRDIVKFANRAALDTYLTSPGVGGPVVSHMTTAKVGQPVRVNLPFNSVYQYNYLRAFNPAQPVKQGDTARAFYYFITDVQYLAPNATQITLQLDVWQTFGYEMVFGNCYIDRGHIGIANEDQFNSYGRKWLTVPEGLDIGGEYQITNRWSTEVMSARVPDPAGGYDILVASNASFFGDPGTATAPNLTTAKGSSMENLPNGSELYVFTQDQWSNFLSAYGDKPWITQGIISITAIPYRERYSIPVNPVTVGGVTFSQVGPGTLKRLKTQVQEHWRNAIPIPPRYAWLKKFLTYPYCVVELTSYTGTPVIVKPEGWQDENATVVEIAHFSMPSPRIAFVPYRYNVGANGVVDSEEDANGVLNDGGEWLDMSTGIYNFPSFSLLNNSYIGYMASNAHGIAYNFQNADWSQQKAIQGANVGFDVTNQGINTSRDINRIGNNAAMAQTDLANQTAVMGAAVGVGKAVVGGALAGGGPGAVVGAAAGIAGGIADVAIGTNQRNMSTAINVGASQATNRAGNAQAQYANDANTGLAKWAAQGDYQNQIAGVSAKLQDAKLMQPSTSGQVGGDSFNLATSRAGYDVKVKMITVAAMRNIGEYWLRYGYAVNQFSRMPESLHVMSRFTYWKLKETYITGGPCPETFKQTIRGIFEKGVTVWVNPIDIGNMDIGENFPVAGITL